VACGRREEDPDLHGGGGGREWLRYDKEIGDFVLQVEWRFIPKTEEPKQYKNAIGVRLSKFGELWVKAQTGGYLFPTGSNSGAGQAIRPPVFAAPSFWSRLVSIASLGALRIPG
jgi:hypothetical protein